MLRIKFLRIDRGLSQVQLAKLAGLPQSYISEFEIGRSNPTDRELKAIAVVLGCAPDRLLDHVSASSLEPGAAARDAYRERRS